MESGESVIPVADFDLRKPDFKKDQEKRLNTISVFSIDNPLFDKDRDVYDKNKDFYGLKIFTPDKENPNEKIYFRQSSNGIIVLQRLEYYPESKRMFSGDIKIIDKESGNFFSVEPLRYLYKSGKNRTSIVYENKLFRSSRFVTDETGGVVVWNENETQMKMIDLKFGRGLGAFFNLFALFHEFGHKYQFKMVETEKFIKSPLVESLKKESISLNKKTNEIDQKLIYGKQLIKEEERNASAFALSLISKLKHLGLDITRGLTSDQINNGIDLFLLTYDTALKRIPGNEISNKKRKKADAF